MRSEIPCKPLSGAGRTFQILGIFYDYSTERGFVLLSRRTLLKYLPDPAVSNAAVYLKRGADATAVRQGIAEIIGGPVMGVRYIDISPHPARRAELRVGDRAVLWGCRVLGVAILLILAVGVWTIIGWLR